MYISDGLIAWEAQSYQEKKHQGWDHHVYWATFRIINLNPFSSQSNGRKYTIRNL